MTEVRPKIKIKMTKFDIAAEVLALIIVLGNIIFLLIAWNSLPDRIPAHTDFAGNVNKYGGKGTLVLLPVLTLVMYLGLTVLSRFPQYFNYAVQITEENAERQYRLGVQIMLVLKFIIIFTFSFIQYKFIDLAFNHKNSIGIWFFPVFIVIVFVPLGIHIWKSIKAK